LAGGSVLLTIQIGLGRSQCLAARMRVTLGTDSKEIHARSGKQEAREIVGWRQVAYQMTGLSKSAVEGVFSSPAHEDRASPLQYVLAGRRFAAAVRPLVQRGNRVAGFVPETAAGERLDLVDEPFAFFGRGLREGDAGSLE